MEEWVIKHPTDRKWMGCSSFEEAMRKWFKGNNYPFKIVRGKKESFNEAESRVKEYLKKGDNYTRSSKKLLTIYK